MPIGRFNALNLSDDDDPESTNDDDDASDDDLPPMPGTAPGGYVRQPAMHGSQIALVAEGDIWLANVPAHDAQNSSSALFCADVRRCARPVGVLRSPLDACTPARSRIQRRRFLTSTGRSVRTPKTAAKPRSARPRINKAQCIPIANHRIQEYISEYTRIHQNTVFSQDTSEYIRIHQNTVFIENPPKSHRKPPRTQPTGLLVIGLCVTKLGPLYNCNEVVYLVPWYRYHRIR